MVVVVLVVVVVAACVAVLSQEVVCGLQLQAGAPQWVNRGSQEVRAPLAGRPIDQHTCGDVTFPR